jgi:putative tryptophan/tyrosine transport system substrate-binding protein
MRRRDLVLAGVTALILPQPGRAQDPGRVYRIGNTYGGPQRTAAAAAFIDGLARLGFVDGKNLQVDDQHHRMPGRWAEQAAAFVHEGVDLIVTGGGDALRATQQATKTIPILGVADNMVDEGYVQSLAHPGGNITGVSMLTADIDVKRLQILLELLPGARRIGILAGGDTMTSAGLAALRQQARGAEIAIRTVGREASIPAAQQADDIATALDALKKAGVAGVNVLASLRLWQARRRIIERVAALGLPAIYQFPEYASEGGLIGYGPVLLHVWGDQLPRMAAAILRGTKPADIPVEDPTRFYLYINLKTARALGLSVPQSILARADEVIE